MNAWNALSIGRMASILVVLCMILPVAAVAQDHASDHEAVTMVWNAGHFDCDTLEMTLVDDWLWQCTAPIPEATTYYVQFWPGGAAEPRYGADIQNPAGLILDDDPSQVPMVFTETGYFDIRLHEDGPSWSVEGAPGLIVAEVSYSDDPVTPPVDTRIGVVDLNYGHVLGSFGAAPDGTVSIPNLMPARNYELTVSATGYDTRVLTQPLPGTTPAVIAVTLERTVANATSSWSGIKSLYR